MEGSTRPSLASLLSNTQRRMTMNLARKQSPAERMQEGNIADTINESEELNPSESGLKKQASASGIIVKKANSVTKDESRRLAASRSPQRSVLKVSQTIPDR